MRKSRVTRFKVGGRGLKETDPRKRKVTTDDVIPSGLTTL